MINLKSIDFSKNIFFKQNPTFFKNLVEILTTKRKWNVFLENNKNKYLYDWIIKNTPKLNNEKFNLSTKIYWILNSLTDFPTCENEKCHKKYDDRNVFSIKRGYPKYCSHKCAVNSDEVKEKAKETCLKKYGTTSPGQNELIKEKAKETCLKKYGVNYSFQSINNKEKTKETLLNKYNVQHVSQIDEVKQKIKNTKEKIFGEKQPWHSKEAITSRKRHWIEKYGVDHPMKNIEVKNKCQKTIEEKYGSTILKSEAFLKNRLEKIFERVVLNNCFDEPLFSFEDFFKRSDDKQLFKFRCKKCGNIFESRHVNGKHKLCEKCFPINHSTSNSENEICDFVKSFGFEVQQHNRSLIQPKELDIYIPEKKLAIEFDGLYWHSEEAKIDKNYHLNKSLACEKQGIQLVHVFESEWLFKKEIVKSRIKNLLGVYDKTVYARKCEIKEVELNISKEFQDANHIQGSVNAKVNLGLYYQDELISLMTFGKCRFDKHHEWELLRFCNKLGYHIPGAASKLLKHFEKTYKPTSLVSYADRRWSQGKVYEKLGFKFSHLSLPNYWYFKGNVLQLESRVKYQKHKLKSLLEFFDESKTEVENMKANGYNRIFACGNLVYEKFF